ncbi:MAG: heme-binding protein [Rhodobacteraceae bacterium]|nr:heme-binding protein [Paracoccaceae bacterium]MCF8512995.1 heme-binding protein [Paracoccaceae bacterium]MCF8517240.1 heme-binding protein [Paracoccaceae bacterium]
MMRNLVRAVAMGMMMAQTAGADTFKGYEMPPYRVEAQDGAREVRVYGPHVVAEVMVAGDRATAISRGFSALAGYIFGGNDQGAKVAMTVPVAQELQGANWHVRFMMPSEYTVDSLPKPNDSRIRFVQMPGDRQVVERFSGMPGNADMGGRADALRAWAAARGLTVVGAPKYYFYDAPMTLPWKRRNEVALTVK